MDEMFYGDNTWKYYKIESGIFFIQLRSSAVHHMFSVHSHVARVILIYFFIIFLRDVWCAIWDTVYYGVK